MAREKIIWIFPEGAKSPLGYNCIAGRLHGLSHARSSLLVSLQNRLSQLFILFCHEPLLFLPRNPDSGKEPFKNILPVLGAAVKLHLNLA